MPDLNASRQRAEPRLAHRGGGTLSVVRILTGFLEGMSQKKWLAKLGWRGNYAFCKRKTIYCFTDHTLLIG